MDLRAYCFHIVRQSSHGCVTEVFCRKIVCAKRADNLLLFFRGLLWLFCPLIPNSIDDRHYSGNLLQWCHGFWQRNLNGKTLVGEWWAVVLINKYNINTMVWHKLCLYAYGQNSLQSFRHTHTYILHTHEHACNFLVVSHIKLLAITSRDMEEMRLGQLYHTLVHVSK